ncbi:MAG: hypothetical protein QXZ31_04855 [Thermofilaceae archaeon]
MKGELQQRSVGELYGEALASDGYEKPFATFPLAVRVSYERVRPRLVVTLDFRG